MRSGCSKPCPGAARRHSLPSAALGAPQKVVPTPRGGHTAQQAEKGHPGGVLRERKVPLRSGQQDIPTLGLRRRGAFYFLPKMQIASVLGRRKMGC